MRPACRSVGDAARRELADDTDCRRDNPLWLSVVIAPPDAKRDAYMRPLRKTTARPAGVTDARSAPPRIFAAGIFHP